MTKATGPGGGDTALMRHTSLALRLSGGRMRQWASGAWSAVPRLCCHCRGWIVPGERHHLVTLADGRERRIHFARCPERPADPPPAERPVDRFNGRASPVFAAIAGALLCALMLLLAGWRPW